jgi:hypothetical protein
VEVLGGLGGGGVEEGRTGHGGCGLVLWVWYVNKVG